MPRLIKTAFLAALMVFSGSAQAGAQNYEPLSAAVQSSLSKAVSDVAVKDAVFESDAEERAWIAEMSKHLTRFIPDEATRNEFLTTVHYEATRAGLDPQLVLGLIQVESGFRKYAVSVASARGFMQVMPFWTKLIGSNDHNLFHLRTNLRYGCTILRHYLDIEKGDVFRALGRYNGSLGQAEYPTMVVGAWKRHWAWNPPPVRTAAVSPGTASRRN